MSTFLYDKLSPENQKALDLQRERLTFTLGGGPLPEGVSVGAVMLQIFLNNKGLNSTPLAINGVNDGATKTALKAFQKAYGLEENGTVDKDTYITMVAQGFNIEQAIKDKSAYLETEPGKPYAKAVNDAIAEQEFSYITGGNASLVPSQQGWSVAAVQHELGKLLPNENIRIDGIWKESDEAILAKWQQAHSLPPTGKFDRVTYDALPWDEKAEELTNDGGLYPARFKQYRNAVTPELAATLDVYDDKFEALRRQAARQTPKEPAVSPAVSPVAAVLQRLGIQQSPASALSR